MALATTRSTCQSHRDGSSKRGHKGRKCHLLNMELCQSVAKGEQCPYGPTCIFAHSTDELRLKTYSERNKDESKFRTIPCFDWVSTGYCPFGVRCQSLHDNIFAPLKSHTPIECKEFPINGLNTTVNVDYQYSTKQSELHHGPIGDDTKQMLTSFDVFCNSICNNNPTSSDTALYSKEQRLEIAIAFDRSRTNVIKSCFEYKAKHMITDPKTFQRYSCMEVQTKIFDVRNGRVTEVHRPNMPGMPTPPGLVTVRELAFCQDSRHSRNSSEYTPGLFFNIPDSDIKKATLKEIKETKRSSASWDKFSSYCARASSEPPFNIFYVRTGGHCGIGEMMSDILRYELSLCTGSSMPGRKSSLESRFIAIKRALSEEKWCSTKGTENRKSYHEVPQTSSKYIADEKNERMWGCFISSPWKDHPWGKNATSSGLNTMALLSEGKMLAENISLPHIDYDADLFDEGNETSLLSQCSLVIDYYKEKKRKTLNRRSQNR